MRGICRLLSDSIRSLDPPDATLLFMPWDFMRLHGVSSRPLDPLTALTPHHTIHHHHHTPNNNYFFYNTYTISTPIAHQPSQWIHPTHLDTSPPPARRSSSPAVPSQPPSWPASTSLSDQDHQTNNRILLIRTGSDPCIQAWAGAVRTQITRYTRKCHYIIMIILLYILRKSSHFIKTL